jgi:RNA polymerase sigma-70 factor
VNKPSEQTEKWIVEATRQEAVRRALDKYLTRDDPQASATTICEFIDALHADDLCLIVACERGDEAAWRDLVARYEVTVRSAARAACADEVAAEDLTQSIWAELYGLRARDDGRPTGKIAYYSGSGSLGGWLRAVVSQLAIDEHRRGARFVQAEEDADFDRMIDRAPDERARPFNIKRAGTVNPESALVNSRTVHEIEIVLAQSINKLAPEDRLLIKLYYFDNLTLREAGAVLGVHEATTSRRIARIHAEIRRRVEDILMKEKNWTRRETSAAFAEITSQLEIDLKQMLAPEASANEQRAPQRK